MSLLIQAQTTQDEDEIMECLTLVLKSARLGLVHESIDVNSIGSYTSQYSEPYRTLNFDADRPFHLGSWFACKFSRSASPCP